MKTWRGEEETNQGCFWQIRIAAYRKAGKDTSRDLALNRLLCLVNANIMKVIRITPQFTNDMVIQFLQDNGDKVSGLAVQLPIDDLVRGRLMERFLIKVGAIVDGELLSSLSMSAQNILRLLDDPLRY